MPSKKYTVIEANFDAKEYKPTENHLFTEPSEDKSELTFWQRRLDNLGYEYAVVKCYSHAGRDFHGYAITLPDLMTFLTYNDEVAS